MLSMKNNIKQRVCYLIVYSIYEYVYMGSDEMTRTRHEAKAKQSILWPRNPQCSANI